MAKKVKKTDKNLPDDEEVISLIGRALDRAKLQGDGANAELSAQRIENLEFYNGSLPARFNETSSSYVSQDVFDAVETRKATLLETFSGNAKPVRFAPSKPEDIAETEIASRVVDDWIMHRNDGYNVIHDVIHDGLMNRNGIVQVWWEDRRSLVPYSVPNLSDDAASAYLAQNPSGIVSYEIEEAEDGTNTLHITREVDDSGVRIEVVPPEEFGINSDATKLLDTTFCWRFKRKTLSELADDGIDPDVIADLKESRLFTDGSSDWTTDETEKTARTAGTGYYSEQDSAAAKRLVKVYEVYITLDTDDGQQLFQVIYTCEKVLKRTRVSRNPFIGFQALRVPHRWWADDFTQRMIPVQKVNTCLTRYILDHGMVTTNPRWMARRGALENPKEFFESRLGGVVNINGPLADAIAPIQVPSLNPSIFTMWEKMGQQAQMRTGSSDMTGAGMKDVLSNQNSADLVQQMDVMSRERTKMMGRNFAQFLKELYERVYQLVVENERRQDVIEVAGNWVFVDPQQWALKRTAKIEFFIGYGERDKEAGDLMQFDQYASAQQMPNYTPQNRYNLLTDVMSLKGHYNFPRYLTDPSKMQPPQPSAAEQLQAQLAQREMAVKEQNANTASMAANSKARLDALSANSKARTSSQNGLLKQQHQELKTVQFQHQAAMDAAEVALQHRAHDLKAIAKPVNTTQR